MEDLSTLEAMVDIQQILHQQIAYSQPMLLLDSGLEEMELQHQIPQ
jgi:hypothetical protein